MNFKTQVGWTKQKNSIRGRFPASNFIGYDLEILISYYLVLGS